MTRKHYRALAAAVRDTLAPLTNEPQAREACAELAHRIAKVCLSDNPHFDADRFFEACGLPV